MNVQNVELEAGTVHIFGQEIVDQAPSGGFCPMPAVGSSGCCCKTGLPAPVEKELALPVLFRPSGAGVPDPSSIQNDLVGSMVRLGYCPLW